MHCTIFAKFVETNRNEAQQTKIDFQMARRRQAGPDQMNCALASETLGARFNILNGK